MRIQTVMADMLRSSFTLKSAQCVERLDDGASFGFVNREGTHALTDGVLGSFDAVRQRFGVSFKNSRFVKLHPFVVNVSVPLRAGEK
jgi:hypothetical protein